MLQTLAKKQSVGDGASSRKALLATTANRRWQASRPQARSQQLRKFARPPRVSVGRSGRKKNRAQKKPDAGKSQGSGQLLFRARVAARWHFPQPHSTLPPGERRGVACVGVLKEGGGSAFPRPRRGLPDFETSMSLRGLRRATSPMMKVSCAGIPFCWLA